MDKETHESLLEELLNPECEHSRKTEILQELRVDYTNVHEEFNETTKQVDKLSKDNSDLVLSNSKLFRQLKTTDDEEVNEEEEKKTYSESITLEQLEKGVTTDE